VSTVLNELQLDALTEMVNIGVNRAAAGLREMVGEQVHLSVPQVTLVARDSDPSQFAMWGLVLIATPAAMYVSAGADSPPARLCRRRSASTRASSSRIPNGLAT